MADEEVLDTQEASNEEGDPRRDVSSRIKQISQKAAEEAKAREKEAKAREKAEAEAQSIAKERDFYKTFNALSSKYQGASELQDKIFEKVKAGYDVEDATISVLAKEGKYTPKAPERDIVAGGSATTNPQGGSGKSIDDLTKSGTREEKRAKLLELLG